MKPSIPANQNQPKLMFQSNLIRTFALAILPVLVSTHCHAHMPWLSTDDQGHALLWFGESPENRTYRMPEKIAAIELRAADTTIQTEMLDRDDIVGIRSRKPVNQRDEIAGEVTYGLYHGTKLTYHVEHLSAEDPAQWSTKPRTDTAMQSMVTSLSGGGIQVTILQNGKPVSDAEVKLYCSAGHVEGLEDTDIAGGVTFSANEVEPGLNAIAVSIKDGDASGTYNGGQYTSTTDYLTATFFIPGEDVHDHMGDGEPGHGEPQTGTGPTIEENAAVIEPSNLPALPEELTSFGAAIADEKLFVYGGHTGNAHSYSTEEQSNRLWCLDLENTSDSNVSGQWKSLPGGPSLQGLALVAHEDRIIRVGGFTAVNAEGQPHDLQSQSTVSAFDIDEESWSALTPLPEPRSSLDAAVLDDTLYVVGGWKLSGSSDDSVWHQTAWSLDLNDQTATWQALPEPPFQRRAISVAAHQGRLFVIGGMSSQGQPTTEVAIYDPIGDQWSEGPGLPGNGMAGFGSSSFATGGKLYVSTMDGFVHQLAEDAQSWQTVTAINPARFFHRMLPSGSDSLLIIGGANMEIGKFTQIDRITIR